VYQTETISATVREEEGEEYCGAKVVESDPWKETEWYLEGLVVVRMLMRSSASEMLCVYSVPSAREREVGGIAIRYM
jgi:hypothetical protein